MSEQTPLAIDDEEGGEKTSPANRDDPVDATNLMMAELAMRAGTTLLRKSVERGFLNGKPLDKAEREQAERELAEAKPRGKAIAEKAGKLAAKSAPVAGVVAAGLLVKNLFDRSQRVRARKYGVKATDAADQGGKD